jgi:hypothetical protein
MRASAGREHATLTLAVLDLGGEVVEADDHVLGGHGHRAAVGRLEDVVGGQHEDAGLGLRLRRQRQVDGHLVTVEVGVERGADERVDLDGLALDQLRLEGLDAEAVQRGCTVEQHRVLGDDLFEDVPHDRALTLDHALGRLDVLRVVEVDQALHHERLEQLERHLLGQAALVQLELRADDDDRTAGVVDALAEQVLAEPALLALEHVGQRLQRAVARAGDRAATAAVVEQASTASCSIRFSLLTMISGAPRSSSRLRRLLRLMTRRYRSLRSEVAKRPPSSCTIGRRSGGMTGTASRTMPEGWLSWSGSARRP